MIAESLLPRAAFSKGFSIGSNVEYVSTDEIPDEIVEREKSIEMGRDDLSGKPDQ